MLPFLDLLLGFLHILGFLLLGLGLFGLGLWINSFKYRHLPGDISFPIIGNLYTFFRTLKGGPHEIWLRTNEEIEKHGNVTRITFGPLTAVAIADPDLIKQLSFHPAIVNKEWLVYRGMKHFLGGVFTQSESNAEWRYYRKPMDKALRKKKVEAFHDVFVRKSNELVEAMKQQKEEFDAHVFTLLHTTDVLTETSFGMESHELHNRNIGLYNDIVKLSQTLDSVISNPILFAFPELYLWYKATAFKHLKNFETKYYAALMKQIEKSVDEDMTQGAERIFSNMGNKISQRQTILDLREIILVGAETTAEATATALLFLGVYPEVQEKLWKEQEEIFQGSDRLPTPDDIKNMKYLQMFVKECSRFVAGPIFPRRCSQEAKLGNYSIPANTTVLICSFKMRTDPKYWEKTTFCPENYSLENILARPKGADTSFGVQPRTCPGAEYAIIATKISISAIVRRLKIHSNMKPEEIYDRHAGITFHLMKPYLITCELRVPSKESE